MILIFVLGCASVFAFLTVHFTNNNLERTFRISSQNAFYLLSFVVDHYLNHERQLEETFVRQLRDKILAHSEGPKLSILVTKHSELQGIWVSSQDTVSGVTQHKAVEKEILNFYQRNLKGKNEHTLILLAGKPFFLINTTSDSGDILVLSEAMVFSGLRIEQVLDSLITSSNLRYFAIINADDTPVLFSTLYENFLPFKGAGQHAIDTPGGRIFQIEEESNGNTVIAGFDMELLNRILKQNNIFLALIILAFLILEGALLASYLKYERFSLKKEREISRLKEVGALSSGFAHEFRNSLHSLTLLAKELDGEERRILLDETSRMKSIMDSLRLLNIKDIEHEEFKVSELVNESTALLDHMIKENNVTILQKVTEDATLKGNRPLLVTALSNMLKNSVEAQARNIKISTHKKGRRLKIDVADDGRGIDPAIDKQVFEPFFSEKDQSGIGLYLAKRIVELHGGEIELTRTENTVFSIILPL